MEHNNSQDHHPNHLVDEQYSRRNNNDDAQGSLTAVNHYGQHMQPAHPYGSTHQAGGQMQHYQQPNNYLQHHYYNNPNQNTWQWMPVAIPPPPPPPPLPILSMGSNVSSPSVPSQSHKGESQISDDQPKRRKRRWGPGVNEQQSISGEPTIQASAVKEDSTAESTDNAIDAIDALSTLESRWNVPQKKKKTRRKRRRKKKGTPTNSDQTNLDAEDMHNVWIDVEDIVKIINPSQSMKQEMIVKSSDKTLGGADTMDFPPLKSETNEEEEKTSTSSQTTERDLNAMDTSELKSYADVLSKALGSASKHPSSYDDDSEMDISEEEENSDETPGPEIVTRSSPEDVCVETTTDQSAVAKGTADEDDAKREKERRALKLAELKAKAKLANAKLRMALQRKALGNTPKDATTSIVANSNGRRTPTYNVASHQTKKPWHLSAANVPALRDISALRNIKTLIIPDVSGTGPDEMVRFIDSVYNLSSSEDDDSSENVEEEEEVENILLEDPSDTKVVLPTNESQKKSQSLKQQLQLAKLRLEIKRKEQLLLEKKRKMPVVAVATDSKLSSNNVSSAIDVMHAPEEDYNDRNEGKANPINSEPDVKISSEEKREKLEKLRQRQKELKQKNEVSNLKNLVNRQRQLLRSQGQELTDSSAQLEDVVRDITLKQALLEESSKRLEEMNHRKKIMEGMMLRATEKLMEARKALGQHKQRSVTT